MKQSEQRTVDTEARYRRLVISHFDFAEAAQFLNQFMALHPLQLHERLDADELLRALTVASVVAYARPFTKNFGAPTTAPRLSIEEVRDLTSEHLILHSSLMAKRDHVFAHSDAEMSALRYNRSHPSGPVPRVIDRRVALTLHEAQGFHALAAKLSIWSAAEASRISGVDVISSQRGAPGSG